MSKSVKNVMVVLFVAIIFWVLTQYVRATDFAAMGEYLASSPMVLPGLLLVSLLGHLAGTQAWKLCMAEEGGLTKFSELFFMRLVGENLAVFNPTNVIAGDGLKAVYLNKRNISYRTAAKSVVLSRVLLVVAAILLMLTSIIYLFSKGSSDLSWHIVLGMAIIGVVLSLGLMHLFTSKGLYLSRVLSVSASTFLCRWITPAKLEQVRILNKDLAEYYRYHKRRLFMALSYSVLHWLCGALEFLVIIYFFGSAVHIIDAVAVEMGVLGFKTAGSMVPGQIGVEEYGNKIMLGLIGVASIEIWLVVSLLRRARQLFWLGTASIASIILYKKYKIKTAQEAT